MGNGGGFHRLLKAALILVLIGAGIVFLFNSFVYVVRVPNLEQKCEVEKVQEVCSEAKIAAQFSINGLGSSVLWLIIVPVVYIIIVKVAFPKKK